MNEYHIDYQRLKQGVEELRKAYHMDESIEREYQISFCLEFLDMLVTIINLRSLVKKETLK